MTVKQFLITVKLPKNKMHNPANKQTGPCPMDPDKVCTDMTGEHHTVLWVGRNLEHAQTYWGKTEGYHVTRIEEA